MVFRIPIWVRCLHCGNMALVMNGFRRCPSCDEKPGSRPLPDWVEAMEDGEGDVA
jgi:hypothetical protein